MPYRLAEDSDPDNPNPHAWFLNAESYTTEAEAHKAGEDRDANQLYEYGEIYGGWLVVYDPIPRGGL
jgi:hypothetical protein